MKILQFALLFSFLFPLSVQVEAQVLDVPEGREKSIARQAIRDLKDGVLFIRLKNYDDMIATLIEKGSPRRAERIRKRVEKFNQDLMHGFKNNFDFCPYYFFDVTDTKKVLNREFEGVIYGDEAVELKKDQKMFVATWGFNRSKGEFADAPTIRGILMHMVEDKKLIRLPKPFPFFVRYPEPLFNFVRKNRFQYHTGRLNNRLHEFFN